jgi:hypothetical protein
MGNLQLQRRIHGNSKNTELIVYDATGTTRTAEVVRQRLIQAGYPKVSILTGTISASLLVTEKTLSCYQVAGIAVKLSDLYPARGYSF